MIGRPIEPKQAVQSGTTVTWPWKHAQGNHAAFERSSEALPLLSGVLVQKENDVGCLNPEP